MSRLAFKRLALVLLGALMLWPVTAHADSGQADIAVTSYSIGSNYVIAIEKTVLDGRSHFKAWQNGAWSGWSAALGPTPPVTDDGNFTGIRMGMVVILLMQPQDGRIYCSSNGEPWVSVTSNQFSGIGQRATPASFNRGGDGMFGPDLGIVAVRNDSFVMYMPWAGDFQCSSLAVGTPQNTGGKTD